LAPGSFSSIVTNRWQREQRSEVIDSADDESSDDRAEDVEVEEACELWELVCRESCARWTDGLRDGCAARVCSWRKLEAFMVRRRIRDRVEMCPQ